MNNIEKILISFSIVFLFVGCQSTKDSIEMKQLDSSLPVVLRLSNKDEKIRMINFPIRFKMINNSLRKRTYSSVEYVYNDFFGGVGAPLYVENGKKLKRVSKSKWKEISLFDSIVYVSYSRHRIDSSRVIQNLFKPYVDKMIALDQDSLAIGTLKDFKMNHPKFLQEVLSKDSLKVCFFNPQKGRPNYTYVSISVGF